MATFVLVHGAFQGGWVWDRVAERLRRRGHAVHAPDLGPDLGPGARLVDLADGLAGLYQERDLSGVTLAAHSISGLAATLAAARTGRRTARLIYLDAVIPEPGRSFADLAGPGISAMLQANTAGGQVTPWPLPVFGVLDPADQEWFGSRLRPYPLRVFTDPFGAAEPLTADRAYIHCTGHAMGFIQHMARQAAALGWPYAELSSGHCPMVTAPGELAEALERLAAPGRP